MWKHINERKEMLYLTTNSTHLEEEEEMFYVTMHSTHFIYSYMVSDMVKQHIWFTVIWHWIKNDDKLFKSKVI